MMIGLLQRSQSRSREGALPCRHLIYTRGIAFFTDVSYLITCEPVLHYRIQSISIISMCSFNRVLPPLSLACHLPRSYAFCVEKFEVGVDVFFPMFHIINVQFIYIYISIYILLFYIAKTT
jgi:hypothetical protein